MKRTVGAFIAGFFGVLAGHQVMVAALNGLEVMPAGYPQWSLQAVPPFGVPAVISKAFWGGLWAVALDQFIGRAGGPRYWLLWPVLGALLLSLVAAFVVPPLKGLSVLDFLPRLPVFFLVNAAWGAATAVILWLLWRHDPVGSGETRNFT